MIKKALRTAAVLAALAIFVCLTPPVVSQAAVVRSDVGGVGAEKPAPDGLWGSLADLWRELVSAIFANSEEEGEENGVSGAPPSGGENNNSSEDEEDGDSGPVVDPNG